MPWGLMMESAQSPIDSSNQLDQPSGPQAKGSQEGALMADIIAALREVYDPDIHVNIYDLGLIYDVRIEPDGTVDIDMTLTSPGCPIAQTFPGTVEDEVRKVDGVSEAHVELVWDPPWTQDRISDEIKLELGLL